MELKFEGTGRFDFKPEELEEYERTRPLREAARAARRQAALEEIARIEEDMKAKVDAEQAQKELEQAEVDKQ